MVTNRYNWIGRVFFFLADMASVSIFATIRLHDRLPDKIAGKYIEIQGYISDLLEFEEKLTRFDFKVTQSKQKVPEQIRLTWYFPEQALKAVQIWRLTVRLKPPHGTFNPGDFDYEHWLFIENIGAKGYVRIT